MKKLKFYLDTSILNFYFADDSPEKNDVTIRLINSFMIGEYEVYISSVLFKELNNASDIKREQLLGLLDRFETVLLRQTEESEHLADLFIDGGVIPQKYRDDALHIAIAAENNIDVILSWNFSHIVKLKTKTMVNSILIREGYKQIQIASPLEVVSDVE